MDFGILTVFWYFGPLQFQKENASILLMKSAPRGLAWHGPLELRAAETSARDKKLSHLENRNVLSVEKCLLANSEKYSVEHTLRTSMAKVLSKCIIDSSKIQYLFRNFFAVAELPNVLVVPKL